MAYSYGDPEKTKDRLVTMRGFLITAFSAVIAAFVGLGSALIAGHSQENTAQTEFVRQQRSEVYAQYLTAVVDAQTRIFQLQGTTQDEGHVVALEEAVDKTIGIEHSIQIIGGDKVMEAADEMRLLLQDLARHFVFNPYCDANPQSTVRICTVNFEDSWESGDGNKLESEILRFTSRAREEFGVR